MELAVFKRFLQLHHDVRISEGVEQQQLVENISARQFSHLQQMVEDLWGHSFVHSGAY
jgi:hypothetical protein